MVIQLGVSPTSRSLWEGRRAELCTPFERPCLYAGQLSNSVLLPWGGMGQGELGNGAYVFFFFLFLHRTDKFFFFFFLFLILSIFPGYGNLLLEPGTFPALLLTLRWSSMSELQVQTQVVSKVSILNPGASNDTQPNTGALKFKNLWIGANSAICLPFGHGSRQKGR